MSLLGGAAVGTAAAMVPYNIYAQERHRRDQLNQQQIMRDREDTAIQRRMADLQAAGLHPTLAAGQPAQSQPANPISPPTAKDPSALIQAALMDAQLHNLKAQAAKTEAETRNVEAQTDLNQIEHKYRSDTLLARVRSHDLLNRSQEIRQALESLQLRHDETYEGARRRLENALKQYSVNEAKKDWEFYRDNHYKVPSGGQMMTIERLLRFIGVSPQTIPGAIRSLLGVFGRPRTPTVKPFDDRPTSPPWETRRRFDNIIGR